MNEEEMLREMMPPELLRMIHAAGGGHALTEIRVRAERPIQVTWRTGSGLGVEIVSATALRELVSRMVEHSFYAWETEMGQGFFTLKNGCRIGVCGRFAVRDGKIGAITHIGSILVRIAREVNGCAETLIRHMAPGGTLLSTLIISPPGMGKTTLLRESARRLSQLGYTVAIADERGEIAACRGGVPALDVGARTDVMDLMPKELAIPRLIRTMAPDVIVTDELGSAADAACAALALRCGVIVLASVHGRDLSDVAARPEMRRVLQTGAFQLCVQLGELAGKIIKIQNISQKGAAPDAGALGSGNLAAGFYGIARSGAGTGEHPPGADADGAGSRFDDAARANA